VTDRGLLYAEQELGVHSVYAAVLVKRNELDECLTRLSDKRDERRLVESLIDERHTEITSDEFGKHPEMTVSGMDRHLKLAFGLDKDLKDLRTRLREVTNEIEGTEYDRSIIDADIKIGLARLQELGGYLQYLAAIKAAKSSSRQAVDTT
jgi:hypothetical protein